MTIAADSSSPTGPPSAADWVAIGVAAASETSVTVAAVVASAPVATVATADSIIIAADAAAVNATDAIIAAPLAAAAGNSIEDGKTTCVCVFFFWPPVQDELLLSMRFQSLVLTSMTSPPYPRPQ